jgi:chemotaxis protein methyltransferase CheR
MSQAELTTGEYHKYCALIYEVAGIRIADNKRIMVSNRVRRRLKATGIASFDEYFQMLTSKQGADEMPRFLDAITTNETYFFRDRHNYEWLEHEFIPEKLRHESHLKKRRSIRIWSAACSTGEEPYAIAIKLIAHRILLPQWHLTILGTDLSGAVLEAARAGSYDSRAMRLVEPSEKARCFNENLPAGRWEVKPEIRAMVQWKRHNLLQPLNEEPFDCIFLKNVLIYFDNESKRRVLQNVFALLAQDGFLVIGPTEGIHTMLDPLHKRKPWLYQKVN